MKYCHIVLLVAFGFVLFSCSSSDQTSAQLTAERTENSPKAQLLFDKAIAAEKKGKYEDAAKLYDKLATRFPAYEHSAEAAYKAGNFWEKESKPVEAFESYQHYIKTYRNGKNYKSALARQADIAFMAAKGGLSKNFLGMKSEPQFDRVIGLLERVKNNAPRSEIAPKAQFAIGTYSESRDKTREAIAAYFRLADTYPNSPLAPEATFRAGKALSGITEEGNQNSSNLNRARRTLEDLIQQYPNSSQAKKAKKLLSEVTGTDLRRTYEIAEFYAKKGQLASARYYYNEVLKNASPGSELHQRATQQLATL